MAAAGISNPDRELTPFGRFSVWLISRVLIPVTFCWQLHLALTFASIVWMNSIVLFGGTIQWFMAATFLAMASLVTGSLAIHLRETMMRPSEGIDRVSRE